jgi:PPK2 family polyphosphate:nucleotide phosphotransferase
MALLTPLRPGARPSLSAADARPPDSLPDDKKELRTMTARLVERIGELQGALYAERRRALLIVLQGRDASGKDGTIRHVFGGLNPQGLTVKSFGAPSEEERSHDFLWRIHRATPAQGFIGVFNRSHYEDVLVVRVRELLPPREWKPRYDQINAFEQLLTQAGTTILKFFLHISKEEQRERLIARLDDPTKNWKFRVGDLEDRDRWNAYTTAYRDALSRCSTRWAPWYVVPADRKTARDYLVAQVLLEKLKSLRPKFPPADPEVLKYRDRIE